MAGRQGNIWRGSILFYFGVEREKKDKATFSLAKNYAFLFEDLLISVIHLSSH